MDATHLDELIELEDNYWWHAAKRRLVVRAGGVVVGEGDGAARLAFLALDEPEEAAERLRARGVLVNVVDRPELCDFTVPRFSIARRS